MYIVRFPSTLGDVSVGLAAGTVTLIAGPNGVGKSALLYQLYRSLGLGAATYFPGHRQINFNQSVETLGQDIEQFRKNSYNSVDAFNRYKGAWAEDQFKGIIRTLINLESAYNRNFRMAVSTGRVEEAQKATIKASPIDQLNVIFSHAGLPIQFTLTGYGLTAQKQGAEYSVEALSDGERASLFIAAGILAQEGGVLLIDEPEKHLHPSITGILIETALRARSDIPVVISSHDMTLIERLMVQTTIYVKDSRITSQRPEQRVFDVELLTAGEIPEQLRLDVLGARSKILYVEGTDVSRDAALYAPVYSGWKVVSKGGSQAVIEAARGVRNASGLHWLSAIGLIDGDGRSEGEIRKLRGQGVLVLPVPTIENLLFLEEAQRCFVDADIQMRGGPRWEERQQALDVAVRKTIESDRDNIIARRTVWRAQREIASQPLGVRDVRDAQVSTISVDVAAIRSSVALEINAQIGSSNSRQLLLSLPIKNTDIPEAAARSLGAASFKSYCEVVQRQIDIESENGMALIAALKRILPEFTAVPTIPVRSPQILEPRSIGIPPPAVNESVVPMSSAQLSEPYTQ